MLIGSHQKLLRDLYLGIKAVLLFRYHQDYQKSHITTVEHNTNKEYLPSTSMPLSYDSTLQHGGSGKSHSEEREVSKAR